MTHAVLFFYTIAIAMSFFHSFAYYFERRWVPITNVQCILQMTKFNRALKQKYGCILFHLLRGFGMVDCKTLHERHYSWISWSQDFLDWHSKHTLLLTTYSVTSSINTDFKKITPWRELNPYLFCHVPSRELQQCQLSLSGILPSASKMSFKFSTVFFITL